MNEDIPTVEDLNRMANEISKSPVPDLTLIPVTDSPEFQLQVQHVQQLAVIGQALATLSSWVTEGGLTKLMAEYAQATAAGGVLQGLATHDGRGALDARLMGQNAIEIVHQYEAIINKAKERAESLMKGEHDSEIHDAEKDFKKFKEGK